MSNVLLRLGLGLALISGACVSPAAVDTEPELPEGAIRLEDTGAAMRAKIFEHVAGIKSGQGSLNDLYHWPQLTAAAGREDLIAKIDHPQYESLDFVCVSENPSHPIDQIVELATTTFCGHYQ